MYQPHMSIHPFILPPNHQSSHLINPPTHSSINPLISHPSIQPPIHPLIYSSVYPSISPFIHSSINPAIQPFIHPTIHPSSHSSNHSSIHPSIQTFLTFHYICKLSFWFIFSLSIFISGHLIAGEKSCIMECEAGQMNVNGKCQKCVGPCPKSVCCISILHS